VSHAHEVVDHWSVSTHGPPWTRLAHDYYGARVLTVAAGGGGRRRRSGRSSPTTNTATTLDARRGHVLERGGEMEVGIGHGGGRSAMGGFYRA
jgi:hypothetical protein